MTFSLLICLSLKTLMFMIKTVLVELIDLASYVIIFFVTNDFTQLVNLPACFPDCDCHSPALLDIFFSFDGSICSTMAFLPLGNSDHVVSGDAHFIA